jgi:hypothetical protein
MRFPTSPVERIRDLSGIISKLKGTRPAAMTTAAARLTSAPSGNPMGNTPTREVSPPPLSARVSQLRIPGR